MYFDRKCKITFICNGSTIYSEDSRFTDTENYPPLSDLGQNEIEKICDFLKKRGVKNDRIYSSPATRSTQSANMVSKLFKQDYEIIEELHPRKCGGFNGMTVAQIYQKYPEQLERFVKHPEISTPDDAESVSGFISRVKASIDNIINDNIGSRIIIVTHRDVIKAAICTALDLPDKSMHKIYIKSGSATQISYYEDWASLVYSDYKPL